MRIAVILNYWTGWGGGIGYVSNIIYSLKDCKKFEVVLALAVTQDVLVDRDVVKAEMRATGLPSLREIADRTEITNVLLFGDLEKLLSHEAFDFIGFTGSPPPNQNLARLWVSYFPDFQHIHYPKYFSQQDRIDRDRTARQILENSALVMLSSRSAYIDASNFLPQIKCAVNIYVLPRFFGKELLQQLDEAYDDRLYEPSTYFVSASQEWGHKRHDVVIEGFYRFLQLQPVHTQRSFRLIFTGQRNNYDESILKRNNRLIDELQLNEQIFHTGYIAKSQQLSIIKNAIALIQASEFEGGPGTSGMLEAAALGTIIIASRIPQNIETDYGIIKYFELNNAPDLAREMAAAYTMPPSSRNFFSSEEIKSINTAFGLQLYAKLASLR